MSKRFTAVELADDVEVIHLRLYPTHDLRPLQAGAGVVRVDSTEPGDRYRRLLEALYDEEAVEGSIDYDNAFAAEIIRRAAILGGPRDLLMDAKVADIVKALNLVLRRFGMGREQRRHAVIAEARAAKRDAGETP